MVVFAIAGLLSPAAAQTVYVERYETYPQLWHLASLTSPQNR